MSRKISDYGSVFVIAGRTTVCVRMQRGTRRQHSDTDVLHRQKNGRVPIRTRTRTTVDKHTNDITPELQHYGCACPQIIYIM